MEIDYKGHYDDKYWTMRKTYRTPDGKEHFYHNPSLQWDGFQFVVDTLAPLVPGKTLLDIGCGGGDLAGRFMQKGYDAYGVDISEYALKNARPDMRGRLGYADITTTPTELTTFQTGAPMPSEYDVVLSTDLLEHIYEEDLNRTFDWIVSKSKRWLFFLVATATNDRSEFVHTKGTPVPLEWEVTAVSGHVNVRFWKYWVKFFQSKNLEIMWQHMYVFQARREMNPPWRDTMGWNMQCTYILQKR